MSGDSPTAIYVEKKSSGEFATPEKIFCQSGKPHGIRGNSGQHISHLPEDWRGGQESPVQGFEKK